MRLEKEFAAQLKKLKLAKGSKCLIALSGGMDSVSLLELCKDVEAIWPLNLCAARVVHNIRSACTEARENEFCHRLCREQGIPFQTLVIAAGAIDRLIKETGLCVEAAARKLRYQSLRRQAEKVSADTIFTAHTADDQLETVLMRVLSGSGPEGIRGIPIINGIIVRPMLRLGRENLKKYLKNKGRNWIEDETNSMPIYTRNRIRNELIPHVGKIFPGWKSALHTLAERAGSSNEALGFFKQEHLPMSGNREKKIWNSSQWNSAPFYIRATAFWHAFDELRKGNSERLPWSCVKTALKSIENQKNWKAHGLSLKIVKEKVILEPWTVEEQNCWKGRVVFSRNNLLKGTSFYIGSIHVKASLKSFSGGIAYIVYQWPFVINFDVRGDSLNVNKMKENLYGQQIPDICNELVYIELS